MPYHLRGKNGGDYKWLADPVAVQVCVSGGTHGDGWEEHRITDLAQTRSKEHLAQIGRKPMKDNNQCHDTNGVPYERSPQPAVPMHSTYVPYTWVGFGLKTSMVSGGAHPTTDIT